MKRGSKFLIGFAAAALTFGSLMAFVGPRHFGHCRGNYGHYGPWSNHGWHHAPSHAPCEGQDGHKEAPSTATEKL